MKQCFTVLRINAVYWCCCLGDNTILVGKSSQICITSWHIYQESNTTITQYVQMGKIILSDDFENQFKSVRKKWSWKSKSNCWEKNERMFSKLHKRFILSSGYKTIRRMYTNRYYLILILVVDNQPCMRAHVRIRTL